MPPVSRPWDADVPNAARIYDYLLGGSYNFAVDRETVRHAMTVLPDLPLMAQAHRAFLHRAVTHLIDVGVRQFVDLGSGIPTAGNVHEVAQRAASDARVLYVDRDPVAVTHSRDLLVGTDGVAVVQEDLRFPDRILGHPETRALLDLRKPIGLLLVATPHFLPDTDDPGAIIARFGHIVAPGSYLVLSHATPRPGRRIEPVADRWTGCRPSRSGDAANLPMVVREPDQVATFFAAFPLVPPGLTAVARWQPVTAPAGEQAGDDQCDDTAVVQPQPHSGIAGVGRKPPRA